MESYKAQLASYIINIRMNICKYLVNRWKKEKKKEKKRESHLVNSYRK